MNTSASAPAAPGVRRGAAPAATPIPTRGLLRGTGAATAALALVALLPHAIFGAVWDDFEPLIRWTNVALPIAFIALTIALWRTRAAHRALLAVAMAASVVNAAAEASHAIAGREVLPAAVAAWPDIASIVLLFVVALDAIGVGVWRAPLRVLLGVTASWAVVSLAADEAIHDGLMWWAAFGTLTLGLAATGLALAIRPGLAEPRA